MQNSIHAVDIIVVNWNAGQLLKDSIMPFFQATNCPVSFNVIIVDNGSSDDSLSLIEDFPVSIIKNGCNLGFGRACNIGAKSSSAEFVLFLNPDTISKPEDLYKLLSILSQNKDMGCIGPRQVNKQGVTQKTCGRFPTFRTAFFETVGLSKIFPSLFTPAPIRTEWLHNESCFVDHVMGSYMLLKRKVLEAAGFFDDDYFVYYEDLDLSRKISLLGYKSFFDANTVIYHEMGGTSKQVKAKRLFYSLEAKLTYWRKHLTKNKLSILFISALTIEPLIRIGVAIIKGQLSQVKETVLAYGYLYRYTFPRGNKKVKL